jgi:hypothetical protein
MVVHLMTSSGAERVLRSKIAAHTLWAYTIDRTQATAKMRAGFDARFEREVDAIDPSYQLSDATRRKLVERLLQSISASEPEGSPKKEGQDDLIGLPGQHSVRDVLETLAQNRALPSQR